MNLDPFNMPAYGANPGARLQQDINTLAPLATQYHGPIPSPNISQYVAPPSNARGSNISQFAHFLGGVVGSIGNIAEGAAKWVGKSLETFATAPIKLGAGLSHAYLDRYDMRSINGRSDELSGQLKNLNSQYKAGKITSDDYKLSLKLLNSDFNDLAKEAMGLNNRIAIDQKDLYKEAIDTAATLVTILTAGLGRATTVAITRGGAVPLDEAVAARFLTSTLADPAMGSTEAAITSAARNPGLFARLPESMQYALQRSTADVLANGTQKMTAGELSRASAINLAFKYPVYFNVLSETSSQIYNDLDKKEYGAAVRTAAFNAMLILSGGPIGQALKYGGKALKGVSEATFGKTAFWDELSKYYGDGTADGFKRAASALAEKLGPEEGRKFIQDLSATEATNMAAMGGDAVAAAKRVAEGMKNQRGFNDLTTFTHEEGLQDMANMSKAQRMADEAGKANGLGPITVGVVDARSLSGIAGHLSAVGKRSRLETWEQLKKQSPTWSWANNANFDKQIKNLIAEHASAQELKTAITSIKASFSVEGFPQGVAKELSKMGYLPIAPVDLRAPFIEGAGKISSGFAENDQFFIRATQPYPVLGGMGQLISRMGMSPNASSQRVYQIFNENVSRNLEELDFVGALKQKFKPVESGGFSKDELAMMQKQGITPELLKKGSVAGEAAVAEQKEIEDVSDYILKKLKNANARLPVSDYRQLSPRQIRDALEITNAQALEVQSAISRAYLQVPLNIRGLGDRAVDLTYSVRPARAVAGRYTKLQGALRFAWNPFFNYLRLIPKTEILTSAEGGGFIGSVFAGRLGQLSDIRGALREVGAFEKGGHFGNVMSGEAFESLGTTSRNLGKKLLPAQEYSISGLIGAQADRLGMDWKTYMDTFPDQVRDTVQMIAEYDRKSNFLNSPLARTLNIAFFPFRFETKVATIFARNLAKSSLMTQVSVVNGLLRAHTWLNSTEGQAWYSQNADAIGLFKYITPIASLNEVFESLLPGHDHHLGNFGELGGLPFGWIPQILDAEGLTNFNAPSVNPKTGDPFPKYIPVTDKGQAAIAVQDLIGSLFSYPGATIGLPSKSSVARSAAQGLTTAQKTDFKLITPTNLSPQQLNYSDTIHQLAQAKPGSISQPTDTNTLTGVSVTPQDSSILHPAPKPAKTGAGASKAKKKKKAEYTPELLPGQSFLGQL